MISLMSKFLNYFDNKNALHEIDKPKLEEFITIHETNAQFKNFKGTVTRWNGKDGIINGNIYFEKSSFVFTLTEKIYVGTKVLVTAKRADDSDAWRATNLVLNNDDWDDSDDSEIARYNNACNIIGDENNMQLNVNINNNNNNITVEDASSMVVIDKISNIYNNVAYLMSYGSFCLDDPICSIKFIVGDWVRCTVSVLKEKDEENNNVDVHVNEVIAVAPLRKKTIQGRVTSARRHYYIMNNEIYCPWNVMKDLNVEVGDTATLDIIESSQDRWNWRVVTYTPHLKYIPTLTSSASKEPTDTPQDCDNNCISIKPFSTITDIILGSVCNVDVDVKNTLDEELTLSEITFPTKFKKSNVTFVQFTVKNSSHIINSPIVMPAGINLTLQLKCAGKALGYVKQECVFLFSKTKCSKFIEFNVIDPYNNKLRHYDKDMHRHDEAKTSVNLLEQHHNTRQRLYDSYIIHGEKPFKAPSFLPNKLPKSPVPNDLWDCVDDREALLHNYPCLEQDLDYTNYTSKFAVLLHLEELELIKQMSQFTIDRACFIPRGEYLCLSVPGLSENRPSVMLGDTILASAPYSPYDNPDEVTDNIQYEGFVHEVHSSEVYLKFHPSFHETYTGKDYSITFCFNRTPLKRCHFAINFVKQQLGQKVLFPTQIEIQLPQVVYIDNEQKVISFSKQDNRFNNLSSSKNNSLPVKSIEENKENLPDNSNVLNDIKACDEINICKENDLEENLNNEMFRNLNSPTTISSHRTIDHCETYVKTHFLPRAVEKDIIKNKRIKEIKDASIPKPEPTSPKNNKVRFRGRYLVPKLPLTSVWSYDHKLGLPSDMLILNWFMQTLNNEQKQAVRRILEGTIRPLPYIIYGPPGTGKTMTVVESILQIFKLVDHSRILVVTPSNSASDLITGRLAESKVILDGDLVRLNAYQRNEDGISDSIKKYCYKINDASDILHRRVIVSTVTTSGVIHAQGLPNGHFTHLFIDEAGQMTEPESCVALSLVNNKSGQIVLAGDPMQLGPIIFSKLAKKYGLQQSLLERLTQSVLYQPEKYDDSGWRYEPRLVTRLVRNYRSHSDIIHVSSQLFYQSSLISVAPPDATNCLLQWPELLNKSCPLMFHGLVSDCVQEDDSPSWFNPAEAFQAVRYAKSLLNYGVTEDRIGIITPYKKQVSKIRLLFETFNIDDIKVGSVEEFQGQERQVVIISTVRSSIKYVQNDIRHNLGFVSSQKRFNVAITRAEALLIVIGNPHILTEDICWRQFIKYCIDKKSYFGPDIKVV